MENLILDKLYFDAIKAQISHIKLEFEANLKVLDALTRIAGGKLNK
ncbi:MAG: hypothetical protein ABH883_01020 [Candidatus Omnitrophota bacterium]